MVSIRATATLILALVMLAVVQTALPAMAVNAASTSTGIADKGAIQSSGIYTLADGSGMYVRSSPGPWTYTAEYTGVGELILITYTNEFSEEVVISLTQATGGVVPDQVSFYSDPLNVSDYGSVQFQVAAEVSDTTRITEAKYIVGGGVLPNDFPVWLTAGVVITWTPQFSNAPSSGTCDTATAWTDAMTYQLYDYPDFSDTPGIFWIEPVIRYVKTTGQTPMGFETTVRGQCVRLRYEIDTPERLFSPRIWARAINRK